MAATLETFEPLVNLFLAGRMPGFNHARHVAIARILKQMPHGRELMHLGLQITAIRAGVPEKYSRELTDTWWQKVEGEPSLAEFADVRWLPQA